MSQENSYRVNIKVRNANLLRAIERAGHAPGQKFSEAAGISYIHLNDLINMTRTPTDRDGNLHPAVEKMCAFLNVMPSSVFDSHQMHNAVAKNHAEFELDEEGVASLQGKSSHKRLQSAVDSVISNLQENEAKILNLRFGIDGPEHTLKQIADLLGVTSERVRQIEQRALRKLRRQDNSDALLLALDNIPDCEAM